MTRKRIIIALIMIVIIIAGVTAGWFIYRSIFSATVNIYFAPKSADIAIGSGGGKFGDNYVKPGTYTVRITKEGFSSYTKEVTVKRGETANVLGSLTPTSDATKNWYSDHPDDYAIAQHAGDAQADEAREYLGSHYPIVKVLPIVGLYSAYRVDYGVSPTRADEYAIYVRYQSESAKKAAIKAVKDAGYDLSKYEVIYKFSGPTDGSTSFVGITSLSNRGVDSDVLDDVQSALAKKYPKSTLTFAETASHSQSSDGTTHTYQVGFSVNGEAMRTLTIKVVTMTDLTVRVDGQTIYTGTVTY